MEEMVGPAIVSVILSAIIVTAIAAVSPAGKASAANGFVQMLEQRFAMQRGSTRVLPECGCTIRYMGTTENGKHYTVHIDKLD